MSRTLNKVILIGNVGKDPELKSTPSGIPIATFRLATSETWRDRDGVMREHTDWHTIVAWRGLAEVINKLVKRGSRIYIEGKIQTKQVEDKTGHKRHYTEILAENMLLLETRRPKEDLHSDTDYSDLDLNTGLDIDPPDFGDIDNLTNDDYKF